MSECGILKTDLVASENSHGRTQTHTDNLIKAVLSVFVCVYLPAQ